MSGRTMTQSVLDAAANHVDEATKDPRKFGRLAFGTVLTVATGADAAMTIYSRAVTAPLATARGTQAIAETELVAAKTTLAAAEGELGADLVSLAKIKHKPAVVIGAADPATGQAVAGRSFKGYCAEREAADSLGVGDKAIQFTKPVRPRTGEVIPVCKECQRRFDRSQFPEGTPFEE